MATMLEVASTLIEAKYILDGKEEDTKKAFLQMHNIETKEKFIEGFNIGAKTMDDILKLSKEQMLKESPDLKDEIEDIFSKNIFELNKPMIEVTIKSVLEIVKVVKSGNDEDMTKLLEKFQIATSEDLLGILQVKDIDELMGNTQNNIIASFPEYENDIIEYVKSLIV